MVSRYKYIKKEEFEEALNSYGLGEVSEWSDPSHTAKEYIYNIKLESGLVLRVYSSIHIGSDGSRDTGKDSIKVVPMAWIERLPKGSYWKILTKAQTRTYRIQNWKENYFHKYAQIF